MVPSTNLTFPNRDSHRAWLATQAALPAGFRVGTTRFDFVPREAPKPAKMTLTLIALDRPTPDFAAAFTKNAFPGAPIIVGRKRLNAPALGAIIINNKISNVCAPGGVETAERVCVEAARLLGLAPTAVLPSSTGVIGWSLPTDAILAALPFMRGRPPAAGGAVSSSGAKGGRIVLVSSQAGQTGLYGYTAYSVRSSVPAGRPAGWLAL